MTKIECDKHGKVRWDGQIICSKDAGGCGRVWHLGDDAKAPPEVFGTKCLCGCELPHLVGTGRPICPHCFEKHWKMQLS